MGEYVNTEKLSKYTYIYIYNLNKYMFTYLVLIKYNKTKGTYKCLLTHITSIIYDISKWNLMFL